VRREGREMEGKRTHQNNLEKKLLKRTIIFQKMQVMRRRDKIMKMCSLFYMLKCSLNRTKNMSLKKVAPVLFLTEHRTMKAYWGSGSIAPPIL
jgi:hypothetical protein